MSSEKKDTINCVLVPDAEDSIPRILEGSDMKSFLPELFREMQATRAGTVVVWYNGQRLKLSKLRPIFLLESTDGKEKFEIAPTEAPVFSENGQYEFRV